MSQMKASYILLTTLKIGHVLRTTLHSGSMVSLLFLLFYAVFLPRSPRKAHPMYSSDHLHDFTRPNSNPNSSKKSSSINFFQFSGYPFSIRRSSLLLYSQAERTTAMLTIIVAVFFITEAPQGIVFVGKSTATERKWIIVHPSQASSLCSLFSTTTSLDYLTVYL